MDLSDPAERERRYSAYLSRWASDAELEILEIADLLENGGIKTKHAAEWLREHCTKFAASSAEYDVAALTAREKGAEEVWQQINGFVKARGR